LVADGGPVRHIALIGGTGALTIVSDRDVSERSIATPYGDLSSPLLEWSAGKTRVSFIARHGLRGTIPPHLVNYRANLWAVRQLEPDAVLAFNAVGGITDEASPGRLVFPNQIIDYTSGRCHTYVDGTDAVQHVEFSTPFSEGMRIRLIQQARRLGLEFVDHGTYGVTQGPRLETAAEIDRMERDGCQIVGMTAMPEASLARELGLAYAICAVVVNRAAGRGGAGEGIHDEVERYLETGMAHARQLLAAILDS
jgi:5'-methylthioinosine phosphorylase